MDTPNYCMGMTGQLKTFFDHMAYRWLSHSPLGAMQNKIAIAVSTTAGAGAGVATQECVLLERTRLDLTFHR